MRSGIWDDNLWLASNHYPSVEKKSIPTFPMVPEVCSVTLLTSLAVGIGNIDKSHSIHCCLKVFVQYPANKVSLLHIFQYLNVLHALGLTSVNSWIQESQPLYLLTEHLTLKVPPLKCWYGFSNLTSPINIICAIIHLIFHPSMSLWLFQPIFSLTKARELWESLCGSTILCLWCLVCFRDLLSSVHRLQLNFCPASIQTSGYIFVAAETTIE